METPQILLLTAERLIAERGVDGVSLREINRAAGQRNASALHYHFGSRDRLIEAIVVARMGVVDAARRAAVDALEASGRAPTLRDIAELIIRPMSDGPGREGHWLQFLAQLYRSESVDLAAIARTNNIDHGLRRCVALIEAACPALPWPILVQRFALVTRQNVNMLADLDRGVLEGQHGARMGGRALMVANLIDATVAILSGPVSPETRRSLESWIAERPSLHRRRAG